MDRKKLVLAIAGKDCTVMLVSGCWENLGFKVNSVCFAPKVWLRGGLFLCDEGEGQDAVPRCRLALRGFGQMFLHRLLSSPFASFETGCLKSKSNTEPSFS